MRLTAMLLGSATLCCVAVAPLNGQAKPRRASPVLMPSGTTPATPAASPAESTRTKGRRPPPVLANRPGVTTDSSRTTGRNNAAQQAVSTQAARAAGAPTAAFTAGLAMPSYAGESDDDRIAYLRTFTTQLDSAAALLVGVFRNTSGQPLAGAESPTSLSARERERWGRCRDLHFDLRSYADAMHELVEDLPEQPNVQRAGTALDSALSALQATTECDNITSMVTAPERWVPWQSQYSASARGFYRDWYGQVRDVADRNRAFVMALNSTLAATSRIPVPPALPRMPPYAGAAIR